MEKWHSVRAKHIGGSEAGAILGLNPYESALTVFLTKKGLVKPFRGNDATRRGQRLEPTIRNFFREKHHELVIEDGLDLSRYATGFMSGNLDGLCCRSTPDGLLYGLEIKTGSSEAGFSADIWPSYYAQIQHYIYFYNNFCMIKDSDPKLIGFYAIYGDEKSIIEERYVPSDVEYQKKLVTAESGFWDDFLHDRMPAPRGIDRELELLPEAILKMEICGEVVDKALIDKISLAHNRTKVAQEEEKRLKIELLASIASGSTANKKDRKKAVFFGDMARIEIRKTAKATVDTKKVKEILGDSTPMRESESVAVYVLSGGEK